MSKLTKNDYTKILEYYEKILAGKLCRCIKKVDKTNEGKSIGICTKTIFNRKGYTRGKFKCKGKSTVKFNKTRRNIK
jgi:hypothetical protein